MILLAAILLYPMIYTIIRSLFGDGPAGTVGSFAWLGNYKTIFTDPSTFRAVKNNVIWVVVAPTVVTILGLIFAVLTERISWSNAFKIVLFMPMAISFLASGVTFELIYADQPSRGLANAVVVGVHDTFVGSSSYPGVHPRNGQALTGSAAAGYTTRSTVTPGTTGAAAAGRPGPDLAAAVGAVGRAGCRRHGPARRGLERLPPGRWRHRRSIDQGELGLPGMTVQAVQNGKVVATTTAGPTARSTSPT